MADKDNKEKDEVDLFFEDFDLFLEKDGRARTTILNVATGNSYADRSIRRAKARMDRLMEQVRAFMRRHPPNGSEESSPSTSESTGT